MLLSLSLWRELGTNFINYRANPGSEFVVANTLAKREKLEPNDLDFSQKVVQCSTFIHGW